MLRRISWSGSRQFLRSLPLALAAIAVGRIPLIAQDAAPANTPYLDPALPVEQRVQDLISRMTLETGLPVAAEKADSVSAVPRT